MTYVDWTDEKVAQLKQMWTVDRTPASEIAKIFHTTKNAILGKLNRLKLDSTGPVARRAQERAERLAAAAEKRRVRHAAALLRAQSRPTPPSMPKPSVVSPFPIGPVRDFVDGGCKWIDGDPGADPKWRTCGHPVNLESAYCPHHHSRAYNASALRRL